MAPPTALLQHVDSAHPPRAGPLWPAGNLVETDRMWQGLSSWPAWYGLVLSGFMAVIGGLAVYDARRRRIPNAVIYPTLVGAALLAFVNPTGPWYGFVFAGALATSLLALLGLATNGGMGMGDAKLAGLIGLLAGWPNILVALFIAFATGAGIGIALVAAGRLGRREGLPFAPALLVGAIAALAAGPQLLGLVFAGPGQP